MGCLFLSIFPQIKAQISSDGSIYSRYGLGELNHFQTSQSQAMGGAGIALGTPTYLSAANPANWSNQVLTRFGANYRLQGNRLSDQNGKTNVLTSGSIDDVQFGFPIKDRKIGVAFAYQPFSRVGYRVEQSGTLAASLGQAAENYVVSYEGSGGIQQFDGGLGIALTDNLRIGGSARLYSGVLENTQRTEFSSDTYVASANSVLTRMFGLAGNFGMLYQKSFGKDNVKAFALGATYTTPAALKMRRNRTLGEGSVVDTLGTLQEGTGKMPSLMTIGAAFRPNEKVLLVADAHLETWSKFESTLSLGGYTPKSSTFKDTWRIGAGFEYVPAGRNFRAPYSQRMAYRFGAYTQPSYFSPKTDVQLSTVALTAGLSFPTQRLFNSIDLNFELGQRGTTQQSLVKDLFYKATLSLNFGDQWFQRFKIN